VQEPAERGHHFRDRAMSWIVLLFSRAITLSPLFFAGCTVFVLAFGQVSFLYFEWPAMRKIKKGISLSLKGGESSL
jgi:hypothetical protein